MRPAPRRAASSSRKPPAARSALHPQLDFRTSDGRACIGWIANDISSFFLFRLLTVFVYKTFWRTFLKSFSTEVFHTILTFYFTKSLNVVPISRREGSRHKFESGFSRVVHLLVSILNNAASKHQAIRMVKKVSEESVDSGKLISIDN